MPLFITLALVAISVAFYYYITRTFDYWQKRNVKHPKPVPLFGNILESAINRKHYMEVLREIYSQFPDEKVVGVYRMTTPCLLIRDLDLVKQILIKDFDKFADRGVEFSREGLGANLFHANADTWRVLRNQFTPIFTSGKLRNMLHLMTDLGDKFVSHISKKCLDQPEQEAGSLVEKYFMANISACAFGLDIDVYSKNEIDPIKKIDNLIFTKTFLTELDMMFPGILLKLSSSLFPKQVTKFFTDIVNVVVNQRNGKPSNRRDFMDLILEMRNKGEIESRKRNENDKTLHLEITDSIMAAQAFVFFSAGYETSTTTMACMLYLLAEHQDVQEKAYAEIVQVLKNNDGKLTYEALNEMRYLDKIASETLRMYPVGDFLQRNAQEDYPLPGTDIIIKKGQTVLFSGYGIHYDDKHYPNPEKFDPERFSDEQVRERHSCADLSFGLGPRNCIGMRFSKISIRVCAAKLLSKFKVMPSKNTPKDIKLTPKRILLYPESGIHLNFLPR